MEPSWRKPVGVLAMLAYIALYAASAVWIVSLMGDLPTVLKVPLYLILGIAWLIPLRPLLQWMNTGAWR